ncbi:MAG: RNA polymerase subunit sigma-70 [Bacteroidetes bacterium]|nr:RNA polymerase subunit sigma-70 [Bacteroidota bacterium]|tara:strand:+ start:152 stop:715 length:564 start_codon:yes stop_codon:yes gene_type:complete
MSEQELIDAIKRQDPHAYRSLIDQYQPLVLNTCYSFVQSEDDAKDLTQEVFIEVIRSIKKFRGESKISTWLYRMAVNRSLNHIKKYKRRSLFGEVEEINKGDFTASDSFNADKSIEDQERSKVLFDAINSLKKNQRIAFTLHKVEGVSYAEIAEIMNITTYSVESLIYRAKSNLQKKLLSYYQKNMQ